MAVCGNAAKSRRFYARSRGESVALQRDGDHAPIVKAQLVRIDACDPVLPQQGERGFRRRTPGNDPSDQCKQRFAQLLCVRQRRRSRCGLALRLSCQGAQNSFRQEMHQRCPIEQARVAVQPVARRLIAASDGIDEVERCVPANEVTGGKSVRFNSNV